MKLRLWLAIAGPIVAFAGGAVLAAAIKSPVEPRIPAPLYVVYPTSSYDLRDDYSRCLAAMDSAEIPASIGQCTPPHVTEDSPGWSRGVDVSVPWGWRVPS